MQLKLILTTIFLFCFLQFEAQINESDPNNYEQLFEEQKRHIFKVNPFFLLRKNLSFSYEQSIKPRQSIEVEIGFAGLGLKNHNYRTVYQGTKDEYRIKKISEGFYFSGGYKFFRLSRHLKQSPNILQGIYFKPEISFGFYNVYKFTSFTSLMGSSYTAPDSKEKVNYKALTVNYGSQVTITKIICLDFFLGIGVGIDNLPRVTNQFLYFGEEHPGIYKTKTNGSLAFKAGIKIGFLLR